MLFFIKAKFIQVFQIDTNFYMQVICCLFVSEIINADSLWILLQNVNVKNLRFSNYEVGIKLKVF
jgi:hypothetical protein